MFSAIRNYILTFLISLLIFGALAWIVIHFAANSIGQGDSLKPSDIETVIPDSNSGDEPEPVTPENPINGTSFNILLIGTDYQPDILKDYDEDELNKDNDGFFKEARKISADTIVLLRVDKETKEFVFSAIPSETRVTVDGLNTRLGYVFGDKGIDFFVEKIEMLTSLNVDYYATVTVSGFENIINNLGKITFDVPKNMNYVDESQNLVIDLKKGTQSLNGNQALQLLRYNLYSDDGETRRQIAVSFLNAMLKAFITDDNKMNATQYLTLFKKYTTTNFTDEDLAENIDLIFAYNEFSMKFITFPGYNLTDELTDTRYFKADINEAHRLFKSYK